MIVRRDSVPQQIRERILEQIARDELRPGDRLIEAAVGEQMGTSPIPVREVSLDETIQAFEIRAALEPLAAKAAARKLRGKCGPLRRTVRAIVAAARNADFVEFQHHNQVFHRTIVAASGNRVLLRMWDSLAFDVRTRFVLEFLTTADPTAIAQEHAPIVDALDRGDARQVAALLRSHSKGLVEYLRRQRTAELGAAPGRSAESARDGRRRRGSPSARKRAGAVSG